MREETKFDLGRVGPDLARRIDGACRRFEADWRAGRAPAIGDYLGEFPEDGRAALLAELEALEKELRQGDETAARPGPGTHPIPGLAVSSDQTATVGPRDDATVDFGSSSPAPSGPARVRYFGDYEIIRELGRGGMGVVFLARQLSLNRLVALKMILAGRLADDHDLKRFRVDADAAANLDHPGIVPIYEIGVHEGHHYFSMGYVEGRSLSHRLAEGPLPPREAAELMTKVAEAIAYTHARGVIHRDLKPGNILLDANNRPRVIDFGLAKRLETDSGLTGSGQVMGTPSYMPPEQAGPDRRQIGPAADIYAMGATLYALLAGRPPFQAATATETVLMVLRDEPVPLRRLNPSIPRDLETICLKCLEKEPARRYPTAAAMGDDLRRYLDDRPISARPVTRWERGVRWARRNPAVAGLSTMLTVVIIAAIGVAVGLLLRDNRHRREALREVTTERNLAIEARNTATAKEAEARAQAELADRRLYGANMVMVQRARDDGDVGLFRRLLDEQRRSPMGADRRGFEWYYWANRDRAGVKVWRQPVWVAAVAFSPDGRWLVSGSTDRSVVIRDSRTGAVRKRLRDSQPIFHVAISPDGRWCGSGSGRDLALWEIDADRPPRMFKLHQGIAFLPGGRFLSRTQTGFAIHEVESGREVRSVAVPDSTGGYGLSPDATRVAIALTDQATGREDAQIWDLGEGRLLKTLTGKIPGRREPRRPFAKGITGVALSPDGRWCAVSGLHSITVWEVESGRVQHVLEEGAEPAWVVCFSPDSRRLATAGGNADDRVNLYDVASGRLERRLTGHAAHLHQVAFSPDGKRLASCDGAGEVRVWEPDAPEVVTVALKADDRVAASPNPDLAFGPDGRWLLAVGIGALVCDPEDGRIIARLPDVRVPSAMSPDRTRLVCEGSENRQVLQVWDLSRPDAPRSSALRDPEPYPRTARAQEMGPTQSPVPAAGSLAFSPDGRRLALGRGSGTRIGPHGLVYDPGLGAAPIRLFELENGRVAWTAPTAHTDNVSALAFSPDGRLVISGNLNSGAVKIHDADSGRERSAMEHEGGLSAMAISPDGRWIATGGFNSGLVILFDLATARPVHTLRRHSGPVLALAFSPDGERLASAGADGRIELWDTRTWQDVLSLKAHEGWIPALAFSPDGHRLASFGRMDRTIKVWDARPTGDEPARPGTM